MTSAWCPRCQKEVPVSTREVAGGKPGEKRVESLSSECGILLLAQTRKPLGPLPR